MFTAAKECMCMFISDPMDKEYPTGSKDDIDMVEQWVAALPLASTLSSSKFFPKNMADLATLADDPSQVNALVTQFSEELKQIIMVKTSELKHTLAAIAERNEVSKGNNKFSIYTGGFKSIVDFHKSIYEEIGNPNPDWFIGMEAEHNIDYSFTTGNYGITTTPKKEWDYVVNGVFPPSEAMGHGRNLKPLSELISLEIVSKARLRQEEVIALVLYTGPMFMIWNAILRNWPLSLYNDLKNNDNLFPTTIFVLISALQKVARIMDLKHGKFVYRGLDGNMKLPEQFYTPDEYGCIGGVENAFMSTTSDLDVAVSYTGLRVEGGKAHPKVLRIRLGAVDRAADISELSQYQGEREYLWTPRSFLEPVGVNEVITIDGHLVEVINVKVNANLKAVTLEEYEVRKKELHLTSFKVQMQDLRLQLNKVS